MGFSFVGFAIAIGFIGLILFAIEAFFKKDKVNFFVSTIGILACAGFYFTYMA